MVQKPERGREMRKKGWEGLIQGRRAAGVGARRPQEGEVCLHPGQGRSPTLTLGRAPGLNRDSPVASAVQDGTEPCPSQSPEAATIRGRLTGSAQQAGSARCGHLELRVADPEVRAIGRACVICLACGRGCNFCQHLQILEDNLGEKRRG